MNESVARVHFLSSDLYELSEEIGSGGTRKNITSILYDDIEFYNRYRGYLFGSEKEELDMHLCMSVRDDPSNHDTKKYFSLIKNEELENLITSQMGYCFGR